MRKYIQLVIVILILGIVISSTVMASETIHPIYNEDNYIEIDIKNSNNSVDDLLGARMIFLNAWPDYIYDFLSLSAGLFISPGDKDGAREYFDVKNAIPSALAHEGENFTMKYGLKTVIAGDDLGVFPDLSEESSERQIKFVVDNFAPSIILTLCTNSINSSSLQRDMFA